MGLPEIPTYESLGELLAAGGELGTFTRTVATAADLPQVYVPGIECFDGNLFLCDGVRVIYVARYRDSGVPKVLHTIQFLTQTG